MASIAHTFLAAGAALLLALFAGRLAFRLHLPRVTGYLLAGLLGGPSAADWLGLPALLDRSALRHLQPIADLALALILLSIGMQFRGEHLRRWRQRLAVLSLCEMGATLGLVFGAGALLNYFVVGAVIAPAAGPGVSSLYIGLFLGIVAMATAPAATLLVIRENEAAGPVTDAVVTLIGLNNLCAILAFNAAHHFLLQGNEGSLVLVERLGWPLLIGTAGGLIMSVWGERLEATSEYQLLVLGGTIGVAGACRLLGYDLLLGCFTCGAVLANAAPKIDAFAQALRQKDYVFYVLFFVQAGAGLHLEMLAHIGLLGVAYVAMRAVGKLLGCWCGSVLGGFEEPHRRWTGPIVLAQAGVAIGMAAALRAGWPGGGALLETVVLGAVVFFELVGPVAARLGLVRAGEVPILALLARRAPLSSFEGVHHVVDHFRSALGIPRGHRLEHPGDILVEHVMRKNVDSIRADTPFQELLRLIAHSRYDRFPIVDAEGKFAGVIAYGDIRDVLFDPLLEHLVVAVDLVRPEPLCVHPQQTLSAVLRIFETHRDLSYLPVLDAESERLVGILSQNDVLAAFRRLKGKA